MNVTSTKSGVWGEVISSGWFGGERSRVSGFSLQLQGCPGGISESGYCPTAPVIAATYGDSHKTDRSFRIVTGPVGQVDYEPHRPDK